MFDTWICTEQSLDQVIVILVNLQHNCLAEEICEVALSMTMVVNASSMLVAETCRLELNNVNGWDGPGGTDPSCHETRKERRKMQPEESRER
jgi:hypothetical protein